MIINAYESNEKILDKPESNYNKLFLNHLTRILSGDDIFEPWDDDVILGGTGNDLLLIHGCPPNLKLFKTQIEYLLLMEIILQMSIH